MTEALKAAVDGGINGRLADWLTKAGTALLLTFAGWQLSVQDATRVALSALASKDVEIAGDLRTLRAEREQGRATIRREIDQLSAENSRDREALAMLQREMAQQVQLVQREVAGQSASLARVDERSRRIEDLLGQIVGGVRR